MFIHYIFHFTRWQSVAQQFQLVSTAHSPFLLSFASKRTRLVIRRCLAFAFITSPLVLRLVFGPSHDLGLECLSSNHFSKMAEKFADHKKSKRINTSHVKSNPTSMKWHGLNKSPHTQIHTQTKRTALNERYASIKENIRFKQSNNGWSESKMDQMILFCRAIYRWSLPEIGRSICSHWSFRIEWKVATKALRV